ncbi:hypothetical protein [Acinetobacter bereziniae]|uniref:hypothetical protein n=2 Tax=Acinetobacter bereziniae TaxID=106648 RepID=UPI00301827E7
MWFQVALFVVSLIISYALQPKTQKPKAAAFEDFDFPTADEGTPQIVVFGDVWLTDWTVIGTGNYRNQPIVAKQPGLFGSSKTTTGYKYFMSIHMGLCRGLDDLLEIKVGDRTLWSGNINADNIIKLGVHDPNLFGGDKSEGGIDGTLTIMRGAPDQAVLPQLAAMFNTKVPAYRGVVTFFYDGLICSNSAYPKPWSFRVRRTTADWDTQVWYPEKISIWLENNTIKAMNPAHILFEAQTNRVWGRGFSASQLDLDSFKNAADQLFSEGFGMCLAWRRQEKLTEFIQQIVNTIGGILFLDRLTGLWKLMLIRNDYNVETLTQYHYSNGLLRISDDSNSTNDVAPNQTIVSYRDPISNEDKTIRAENIASIQQFGVISETKTYAGIPTSNIAGRIAARDMKVAQSNLKKFKLVFDRRAYAMQPMTVFKISLPEQGINSIVLRAVKVEHDNVLNGEITVTALQDVFGLPASNYVSSQPSLWQPPNHKVLPTNQESDYRFFDASYYDMCSQFTDVSTKVFASHFYYYASMTRQPNPLHLMFKMWLRQRYYDPSLKDWVDSGFTDIATTGNYCPIGKIINDIHFGYAPVTVRIDISIEQLEKIKLKSAALIQEEIVRVDAIDYENFKVTLSRGCVDSLAGAHIAGTEIWFYEEAIAISSKPWSKRISPQYANYIYYKFQNFTKYEETDVKLYDETDVFRIDYYSVLTRAFRSYPPAHVLFDGNILNYLAPCFSKPVENVTWRNRNRLTQADSLLSQQDASIDIEYGTYTEITISLRQLNGNFYTSNLYDVGQVTTANLKTLQPDIYEFHAAQILIRTRNNVTAMNDPSINAYIYDIEWFGFGMNFGRHFGGHNG